MLSIDSTSVAPFRVGDQVVWNERWNPVYISKYKAMWGEGPFVIVSVVLKKNSCSYAVKVKMGRWYLYAQMPRDCRPDIPVDHLREWQPIYFVKHQADE